MWDDYAVPGGSFRENLLREPGASLMPEGHPAVQFRYENLKKQKGILDEKGDINIKRSVLIKPKVDANITVGELEEGKFEENANSKRRCTSRNRV
jgi:hypothetical protein